MNLEPRAGDRDGFFVRSGAAAFFGELREGDRRRILLDPAPQIVNPRRVGHRYGTDTDVEAVPVRPRLSVTVSVTVNDPVAGNVCVTVGDDDGGRDEPSPNDH